MTTTEAGKTEALRKRILAKLPATCRGTLCDPNWSASCECVSDLIEAIGLTDEALAYAASHPDEIQRLAEGTMVATPRRRQFSKEALSSVVALFTQNSRWTAAQLKARLHHLPEKKIHNALGYLVRRKELNHVGYGQYELPASGDKESALQAAEAKIAIYKEALDKIERWFGEFPETGDTWKDGTPVSYGAAYGSNGERDFMRSVARAALSSQTNRGDADG